MKFSVAAALASAAAVSANYNGTVVYTTQVVTSLETYCPAATTLTHNGKTYTVTKPTTLTITDCPCTISKPIYTTSVVYCTTCNTTSTKAPVTYTTPAITTSTPKPTTVTAGAGTTAAFTGAGLVAFMGFVLLL